MSVKSLISVAVIAMAAPAMASTVFFDNLNGAQPDLATQQLSSGATTGFTYWGTTNNSVSNPLGGDMDAGYFSVVNKARDIHNSFVSTLDADNNANGSYAVYNGFSNQEGVAYKIILSNLVAGQSYSFSAALLSLTTTQFPQISAIMFRANGVDLVPDTVVTPQPAGDGTWGIVSRSFVASAGNNVLEIVNLGSASNAGNDFGIDNVTVASRAAVIPLPASAAMGISTLALATLRRRR
jgi:hypothetical protein